MNETDTPDNGASKQPPLSEITEITEITVQSEPVDCPFYSVIPNQNLTNTKLSPVNEAPSEQVSNDDAHIYKQSYSDSRYQVFTLNQEQWESETITNVEQPQEQADALPEQSTQVHDWVAEPDGAHLAAVDAEFQQMLALNHELRTANDELYKKVEELTSRLAESEKAVQFQQKRYSVTEAMLKQQTQELCAVQDQVKSVYQQLENSLQNVQRQETLIETYKAQLEFNQQRLAQLERECALLQTNYSSQSQQLIQSETACNELRTRLMRQQRQTLQFKAALEKCLDPVSSGNEQVSQTQTTQPTIDDSASLKKFKSLFVNAQPIKPWSGDLDSEFDFDTQQIEENTSVDNVIKSNTDIPIPQTEPTEPVEQTEPLEAPLILQDIQSNTNSFDEQIDSVIQMYFVSQSAPISSEPISNEIEKEVESKDDIWDTVVDTGSLPITPEIVIEPSAQNRSNTNTQEIEDYWAEVSQLTNLDLPAIESPHHPSHNIDDANSPSPVVYPKRPPKGRKSLASVQLPKFPPPP